MKNHQSGFTIMEALVALSLVGILITGTTQVILFYSGRQKQLELRGQASLMRLHILSNLQNPTAWKKTLDDTTNVSMACLRDSTACAAGGNIKLVDLSGVLYDGISATSGFTPGGVACSAYSSSTGNDDCPLHVSLQWEPVCSPLPCIARQIKIIADINYNPQNQSKKFAWNLANYHLEIFKDIGSLATCGPLTISIMRTFSVTETMNITYAITGGGGGGGPGPGAGTTHGANGAVVTGNLTALAGDTLLFVPGGGGGGGSNVGGGGGGSGYMGGGGGGKVTCPDGGAGGSSAILKNSILVNFGAGGDGSYCGDSVNYGTGAPARGGGATGGLGGQHYTGGLYGTAGSNQGAPGGADFGGPGVSNGGVVLCYPNPYGDTACGGSGASGGTVAIMGGPNGYGGSGGGYGSGGGGGSTSGPGPYQGGRGGNNGGSGTNGLDGYGGTTVPGGYGGFGGNGAAPPARVETGCGYYGGGWCSGVGYGPGNGGCGGRFPDGSFCHGGGMGVGDGGGGGNIRLTYTAATCTL